MDNLKIQTNKTIENWTSFTLINDNDVKISLLDFGGIITEIIVPDKNGNMENIVLGYHNYEKYKTNPYFFGAIIGRVAGRIQNSSFTRNGESFFLEVNEGKHHLHGGNNGFHKAIWEAEPFQTGDQVGVKLTHTSPDGEGGYPGNIQANVTYTLTNDNQLIIDYDATTDKTTALTMTNHSYFNLNGNVSDTIRNHHISMNSQQFIELNHDLIPTGNLVSVDGTPFDFIQGRMLEEGIHSNYEQNKLVGNGYDHYFIFDENPNVLVTESNSGRTLAIQTNQPGMVMYTSNSIIEDLDQDGIQSEKYLGVCFETQASPASLHFDRMPTVVLEENQAYKKQTVFTFGIV